MIQKSFQNNSVLSPFNISDASSALAAAHSNSITQTLCSKDGILPDPSMIHGRLLVICWENDLGDVEDQALPLVIYALRVIAFVYNEMEKTHRFFSFRMR